MDKAMVELVHDLLPLCLAEPFFELAIVLSLEAKGAVPAKASQGPIVKRENQLLFACIVQNHDVCEPISPSCPVCGSGGRVHQDSRLKQGHDVCAWSLRHACKVSLVHQFLLAAVADALRVIDLVLSFKRVKSFCLLRIHLWQITESSPPAHVLT